MDIKERLEEGTGRYVKCTFKELKEAYPSIKSGFRNLNPERYSGITDAEDNLLFRISPAFASRSKDKFELFQLIKTETLSIRPNDSDAEHIGTITFKDEVEL